MTYFRGGVLHQKYDDMTEGGGDNYFTLKLGEPIDMVILQCDWDTFLLEEGGFLGNYIDCKKKKKICMT